MLGGYRNKFFYSVSISSPPIITLFNKLWVTSKSLFISQNRIKLKFTGTRAFRLFSLFSARRQKCFTILLKKHLFFFHRTINAPYCSGKMPEGWPEQINLMIWTDVWVLMDLFEENFFAFYLICQRFISITSKLRHYLTMSSKSVSILSLCGAFHIVWEIKTTKNYIFLERHEMQSVIICCFKCVLKFTGVLVYHKLLVLKIHIWTKQLFFIPVNVYYT